MDATEVKRVIGMGASPMVFCLGLLVGLPATAQPDTSSSSIYTCVDARGRKLTSDRPIAECLDREQRVLGPMGATRRTLEPSYTATEQAERDDRARDQARRALLAQEEKRRERALLMRFPNLDAHSRARADALLQIDAVIQAARKRMVELVDQRKLLDQELEFYKGDPALAPGSLQRQLEDNTRSCNVQLRFLAEQEEEKRRVNSRFDEEVVRLKVLWAQQGAR